MNEDNFQNPQDYGPEMEPVMGIGQWLLTLLVMSIPCVNIIMLFVWGFGSENQTRANYCRAYLIWWVICVVLMLIFSLVFGSALTAAMSSMSPGL
jgi:hypothetical protein